MPDPLTVMIRAITVLGVGRSSVTGTWPTLLPGRKLALPSDRVAFAGSFVPLAKSKSEKSDTEIGRATSELQSLMRISYAVFCLKKKNKQSRTTMKQSSPDN